MRPANTVTARLYLHEDHTAAIDRLKSLTDNPSLTRILSTVLRLIENDHVFAERILTEIKSDHLTEQLKQWFQEEKG